jgi:hypothetical protein
VRGLAGYPADVTRLVGDARRKLVGLTRRDALSWLTLSLAKIS